MKKNKVIYFIFAFLIFFSQATVAESNGGFELKVFHFPLVDVSLSEAKWLIDTAHEAGFNSVQILLREGVKMDMAPWEPKENAWEKADLIDWVSYARSRNFIIIPEIKLLTHQEKFLQDNFPHLLYNKVTYDPRLDQTYKVVFNFIDEVIDVFNPHAIHIGHDELKSPKRNKRKLNLFDKMLPADLYLLDVIRLNKYLTDRNIDTWIWGDMFLSSEEFPGMLSRHLHAKDKGYGRELREQLPRNIVICDWHYFDDQIDFPSLSAFQNDGFRVIGVTWKKESTIKNFSKYALENNAYGMMATLWFHVRKKEFDKVDRILKLSGSFFNQKKYD